ncbi:MAG: hypothetical protein A2W23_05680 [Planctomycetes bacterium RBG_16_43_13]|nr:MAG: hypothetical protein A2W23_05680 [Planctomycetes bacterium RBG_16_43_13]
MASRIKELEKEKEILIVRYLKLQDMVDGYNEEIYNICCEIEALNKKIDKEKEDIERKAHRGGSDRKTASG